MACVRLLLVVVALGGMCVGVGGAPMDETEVKYESEVKYAPAPAPTSAVIKIIHEPDDVLNWFFHHSFQQMDQYLKRELDLTEQEEPSEEALASRALRVRAVKVLLKLVLVVVALVSMVLFVSVVTLCMFLAFIVVKFISHFIQSCAEKKTCRLPTLTRPKLNTSTSYSLNL